MANKGTEITLEMMRQSLYSAVVCDALDAVGLTFQSPRLQLKPTTVTTGVLVGRCPGAQKTAADVGRGGYLSQWGGGLRCRGGIAARRPGFRPGCPSP